VHIKICTKPHTQPASPSEAPVLAWCDSGFHLVNVAKAVHVHRNTLIYRLGNCQVA
jgi:carbohydrate diacid regulator